MRRSADKADVYKSCTRFIKYKAKIMDILKIGGNNVEEKHMVNDILESVKAELLDYQQIISETEDMRP